MPKLFLSYRRTDSEIITGRIYDRLRLAFDRNQLFKDVHNIPPGEDFREVIERGVDWCDMMLVIIGPDWTSVTDAHGRRRLDDPDDYVRLEIQKALENDSVQVLPLLVKGATPPSPDRLPVEIQQLAYINALPVRNDPDFEGDIERLLNLIRVSAGTRKPTTPSRTKPSMPTSPDNPLRPQPNPQRTMPDEVFETMPSGVQRRPQVAEAAAPVATGHSRPRWLNALGVLGLVAFLGFWVWVVVGGPAGLLGGDDEADSDNAAADFTPTTGATPQTVSATTMFADVVHSPSGDVMLEFAYPAEWGVAYGVEGETLYLSDIPVVAQTFADDTSFPPNNDTFAAAENNLSSSGEFLVLRIQPLPSASERLGGNEDGVLERQVESVGATAIDEPHDTPFGENSGRGMLADYDTADFSLSYAVYALDVDGMFVQVDLVSSYTGAYTNPLFTILGSLSAHLLPE